MEETKWTHEWLDANDALSNGDANLLLALMLKNEKMADSIAKMHALKRIGEGKDFASMVNFLLSQDSSWMTGQIIGVDGGRSSVA